MDLIKYVMGVAAKSNVEKRQVGCVITDINGRIIAEGFNEGPSEVWPTGLHAEAMACEHMAAQALNFEGPYTAHVTHPPCPECAKMLADYGVKEVKTVEAFMKFDSDKLRYDLVEGEFMELAQRMPTGLVIGELFIHEVRIALWRYAARPVVGIDEINYLNSAMSMVVGAYDSVRDFEDGVVRVLTFGARKYKANNWQKCTETGRYLAAAHRHLIAIADGHDDDHDSGLDHLDHVATNLMFLYTLGLSYE